MSVPLDLFFTAMAPFLERRAGVDETTRVLGASPSGDARFALYPEFIRRQKRSVLDHFYASVRAACDVIERGLWERFVEGFILDVAPLHWDPNRYAGQMLECLVAKRAADRAIHPVAIELADFAWIRFSAMNAAYPSGAELGLETAMFIRHYDHDVAHYALAVEDGSVALGTLPESRTTTILVCRSRHTARLEIVTLSLAALIALRRRELPNVDVALPRGLTVSDVDREDSELVRLGALSEQVT